MNQLEESIFQFVNAPGYRPVKPRAIAQQLKLSKDQAPDVRRAIKRLVHQGRLGYGSNHLVTPASAPKTPKRNRLTGVFQRRQKGFGFVRLTGEAIPAGETKDIFIPADRAGDAATGDVVLVELKKPRPGDPGPRGEIVEIVDRQTHQFVGTYFESAGAAYVQIDGGLFTQPIYVGDPGAKNARIDDKVVIEMVRFPSPLHDGEGVITEVLGPRGKPGVDTLSIIRQFNLPEGFADECPGRSPPEGRNVR